MTLCEKLIDLRRKAGLSQEQMAQQLDVSRQAVSKWECGDAAPDLDKLRTICTYFGVTTDYLIWENEEDTPQTAASKQDVNVRGRNGIFGDVLLLVLLGSWWGVRRRDRAAEQEAEAEHLLAGAGDPNALPRRWVTLFWSQRSSIAESRWAGMVESSLIIGSDAAQCDLCLPDRKVSPQHCVLAAQGDALLVQPLSDRAKVYVNGERIDGEHRLQNNDTLRIGKTTVRLVL